MKSLAPVVGFIVTLIPNLYAASPPKNALTFETFIGKAAAIRDEVEVQVKGTIEKGSATVVIHVFHHTMMGAEQDFDLTAASELSKSLTEASDAFERNQPFGKKFSKGNVSIVDDEGKKVIKVNFEKTGFMERSSFEVDGDNAPLLSRMIQRGVDTAAWLRPRLDCMLK